MGRLVSGDHGRVEVSGGVAVSGGDGGQRRKETRLDLQAPKTQSMNIAGVTH